MLRFHASVGRNGPLCRILLTMMFVKQSQYPTCSLLSLKRLSHIDSIIILNALFSLSTVRLVASLQ